MDGHVPILGGRLIMINAVLSAIPTHFMTCFIWPKKGVELLDKLRRIFFWDIKDQNGAGHCLVAWNIAMQSKENGGLGIRNLREHNKALLCKFLSKVLQSTETPCYQWLADWYLKNEIPLSCKTLDTATWRTFSSLIPLVQNSTKCKLGSGNRISFWYDHWTNEGNLRSRYPNLFSFAKTQQCTVASQFTGTWTIDLHPNLSHTATAELHDLNNRLGSITPEAQAPDIRIASLGKAATTSYFYKLNTFAGVGWEPYDFVWDPIIPKKYSVFLWLAFRNRLNTRENMFKKNWTVSTHAGCELCPALETISHILLRCRAAQQVWRQLNIEDVAANSIEILDFAVTATELFEPLWHIAFAASAVILWEARNAKIFENQSMNGTMVTKKISDTLKLWSNRAKKQHTKEGILQWANKFT